MNADNVQQKLEDFVGQIDAVRFDRALSAEGKRDKEARLRRELDRYREVALSELERVGADVRERYQTIEKRRAQLMEQAQEGWDYVRLGYERDAVRSFVDGAVDLPSVLAEYQRAGDAGNRVRLRAFAEFGATAAKAKFGAAALALEVRAQADLRALLTTPQLALLDDDAQLLNADASGFLDAALLARKVLGENATHPLTSENRWDAQKIAGDVMVRWAVMIQGISLERHWAQGGRAVTVLTVE